MRVFVNVADSGSFAQAARQLNMSPPAVTRAIAGLESEIGARLLTRTTRSLKLTESGQGYLQDVRRILTDIDEAEAAAAGSYATPTGVLTITAPVLFGQIYVLPILTKYLDEHPNVIARALFLDRITNMMDEGIDVAVRIGPLPDSSIAAVKVGSVRRVVCGAPSYFARHGIPKTPAALTKHRIIATSAAHTSLEWRFGGRQNVAVRIMPKLMCNSNQAAVDAAIAGWGLTRLLSYQIGPALKASKLQIILTDYETAPRPIHVVHTEGRRAAAKVRTFVDFAASTLRQNSLFGSQATGE